MDLEAVKLSEVSQTEKDKYMVSLIYEVLNDGTDESIYKIEIESHVESNLIVSGGRDKLRDWDGHAHTTVCKR